MATSTIKVNSIMGGEGITSEVKAIAVTKTLTNLSGNVVVVDTNSLTNGVLPNGSTIVGVSAFVGNLIGSNGAVVAGARLSGTNQLVLHISSRDSALPSSYSMNLRLVIFYT